MIRLTAFSLLTTQVFPATSFPTPSKKNLSIFCLLPWTYIFCLLFALLTEGSFFPLSPPRTLVYLPDDPVSDNTAVWFHFRSNSNVTRSKEVENIYWQAQQVIKLYYKGNSEKKKKKPAVFMLETGFIIYVILYFDHSYTLTELLHVVYRMCKFVM